ncbi:MAG: TolC family outer membrane protein [Betaproteobacteria bacterium]|nr:TolC family outer membrane protein [Betaproteobacteria bacterium]
MKRLPFFALASLFIGSAHAEDLLQVYRDAVEFDAQYMSAKAQSVADTERKTQGLAGLLPQIGASAATQYNDVSIRQPISGSGRYNTNNWGVQLTQPLFRVQNWQQFKQGELAATVAELQLTNARQDLMLRVANAYFDLLNSQETLASIVAQKNAAEQQLGLAKKSFEVGATTITDVYESQSRFDLAAAGESAAIADVEVKLQTLRQLTGKRYGPLAPLRSGVHFNRPQPDDVMQWAKSAEMDNLSVQMTKLNYDIADRQVTSSRAGHLPTVDLVASYGHQHAPVMDVMGPVDYAYNSTQVGVQLQVPIFAGGYTQSKVRESLALRDRARSDYENAQRSAHLGAQQAYLGLTSGIAQVAGYEAALLSSRSAVEANKLGYQVGVRINIDVLNAETQFYDTFRQLARARYDTLLAQLRLKNAVGNLSEEDLQIVNGLLDPASAGKPIALPDTTPPTLGKDEFAPRSESPRKSIPRRPSVDKSR